jgi:cytochrome c-type biogenesis protein CcmH/NrfG
MNPLFRLVATLTIVGVVAFASRSAPSDAAASAESVRCEIEPPTGIAGLETCVAWFPRDVELLVELGAAYEAAGRNEDARSTYRRATEIDPRDADAQRRLAGLPR